MNTHSATTTKLHEAQAQLKGLEAQEAESRARLSRTEEELREAREAARRVGQEAKTEVTKLRLQLQDATHALAVVEGDREKERAKWHGKVEELRKELKKATAAVAASAAQQHQQQQRRQASLASSVSSLGLGASATGGAAGGEPVSQTSILERTMGGNGGEIAAAAAAAAMSPGMGEVSVLALEKLRQALRQKEAEVLHLQMRLREVG